MGLRDFCTKMSAQRQAKKDAKEQAKWILREEELMNSYHARNVDREFHKMMAEKDMERKVGNDFHVWAPKASEAANGEMGAQEGKNAGGAAAGRTAEGRENGGQM